MLHKNSVRYVCMTLYCREILVLSTQVFFTKLLETGIEFSDKNVQDCAFAIMPNSNREKVISCYLIHQQNYSRVQLDPFLGNKLQIFTLRTLTGILY